MNIRSIKVELQRVIFDGDDGLEKKSCRCDMRRIAPSRRYGPQNSFWLLGFTSEIMVLVLLVKARPQLSLALRLGWVCVPVGNETSRCLAVQWQVLSPGVYAPRCPVKFVIGLGFLFLHSLTLTRCAVTRSSLDPCPPLYIQTNVPGSSGPPV